MQDRVELSSVPPEVLLGIFCSLSAFPDILQLAATCQKHRQIFHNNILTIYRHVSPRAIPCRRYARKLLADQGGSLPYETPTVQDFLQMTRNSIVMEKSVKHFNATVVTRMTHPRRTHNPGDRRFFGGDRIRPPYLTERERRRFIRAAYQLWSLTLLDSTLRQLRMSTLKYKDLYALTDLARIQFWAEGGLILDKECIDMGKADTGPSEPLGLLDLYEANACIFARFYHEGRRHVFWDEESGWVGCVSIWENWIEEYKASVVEGLNPGESISEVWYETSDEELMGSVK